MVGFARSPPVVLRRETPHPTEHTQVMLSKFAYDGNLNPNWREGPFKFVISEIDAYSNAKTPK